METQVMTERETISDYNALQEIAGLVMDAIGAQTLEQVLQRIADVARELVGTKFAALGIPDGKGGLEHFKVSGVSAEDIAKVKHPPLGKGLLGVIMNERVTVLQNDLSSDPRSVKLPPGHPPLTSMLGVPIQATGELFGMLYLSDKKDGYPFDTHDQWLVETLAGYAALAIAGTQLRENQRRITLLEERQRIGMELHDGIIQSLYAVGMNLDLIRGGLLPPEAIDQSIEGLNLVIDDIRAYILDLRTRNRIVEEERGETIRKALADIVARFYVPGNVTVSINAPDEPPQASRVAFDSLCMIAREAFSNAIRHAQADYITVRCDQQDSRLQLLVRDNGRGFDVTQDGKGKGLGLQNMQERVRSLSGDLQINSEPGRGTGVLVTIPLRSTG